MRMPAVGSVLLLVVACGGPRTKPHGSLWDADQVLRAHRPLPTVQVELDAGVLDGGDRRYGIYWMRRTVDVPLGGLSVLFTVPADDQLRRPDVYVSVRTPGQGDEAADITAVLYMAKRGDRTGRPVGGSDACNCCVTGLVNGRPTRIVRGCEVTFGGRLVARQRSELVLVLQPRRAMTVTFSVHVANFYW